MTTDDAYARAPCGLLVTTAQGRIERVNDILSAWTGFSIEELSRKRFQDLLSVGSKLFHQTHWMPLLQIQGSVAEVQLEIVHRDGRALPVLVNAAQRGVGRVDIAVFVATDRRKYERELLEARRRAEALLDSEREAQRARARAEAQLRLALDSANLRVWVVDLPGGARRYDPDVATLIGDGVPGEVPAAAYEACIDPRDREREAEAFAAALDPARRAPYSVEYRLLGRDGRARTVRSTGRAFFDEHGAAVQFSGILEDVTDRRADEEMLRLRENEFRMLAENSPDLISRFDPTRRCLYVNPAARRIGWEPAACVGRRIDDFDLAPEAVARWAAALDEALAGRDVTFAFSLGAGHAQRELEAHVVPERHAGGPIVSVLAMTRDVTGLKLQEREARQRALLAEQFVGIVSHDLRSPLNAVLLGARLLDAGLEEPQKGLARRIVSAVGRANRLIADLLDFTQARLGGGLRVYPREADLHRIIADCLDEVRLAWPGRALEHRRIGEGACAFDPDRFAQVVSNLVNNAFVYGLPDAPVVVTSAVTDDGVELLVHNDGPPIPEELKGQVFEPMRRGEQAVSRGSRSVGLGLYIVREIAVAHGGGVAVHSHEGEGTTFVVRLPCASAPS